MHVIIDICVVPIGVGVSVSPHVAACQEVIDEAGLDYRLHAYGTNVEGPWDEVMAVVKRCHEVVHDMGAPRITTTMKISTRTDRVQHLDEKVASVTARTPERD
ncbi:MTH1187 family thiamine-binding protein [Halomonas sabkhae]|uniref:MTH1187 family thiamine-binding protein n=1 Tax=Halomonas sabkhae TaxID=626223 RepID=UPI0025B4B9C6|nr:MTH1187 family thiamine-binding protein [Halomonas sabkhae]MDN3523806.1 MTH1187 family thiamine-binding protein [Halomonas sabkhae]